MDRFEVGCLKVMAFMVIAVFVLFSVIIAAVNDMKRTSRAMAQQFTVGAPLIPFSLTKSGGHTMVLFSREDEKEADCPSMSSRDGRALLWFGKETYAIKLEDLPQKLVDFRDRIAPCDKLSVYYNAWGILDRTRFDVHYDASGNVTKIHVPF